MFQIIVLSLLLTIPSMALAQNPIPRQEGSCPIGTYKFGDYCKSFKSSADQAVVEPDCIGNDIGRESVAFISIHPPILSILAG